MITILILSQIYFIALTKSQGLQAVLETIKKLLEKSGPISYDKKKRNNI